MNQNLTVFLVFFKTLKIMIDAKRYEDSQLRIQWRSAGGRSHLVEMSRCYRKDVDVGLTLDDICCL